MILMKNMALVVAGLASALTVVPSSGAQDALKQEPMKQDEMKQGMKQDMKQDGMTHDAKAKTVATGKFHSKVHKTEGRATIYQEAEGKLVLRLTGFSTSNGPDVHVILVRTTNAADEANFMKSNTDKVELGSLKGNKGDQNYEIPAGTDLSKFTAVSIYCERFSANFGTAPLEKF
jgi:pentapeptide MXKDX repeat protein